MPDATRQTQLDPLAGLSADELRSRLRSLYRLLDVTRTLAHELDLDRVLATIARDACVALECDRASVFQYDAARRELFTRTATELEIDEIRHTLDRGITGHVARTLEIANIADVNTDPHWNWQFDLKTGYTTRSVLAAPIVSSKDGSLLGVLQLLNKNDGTFDAFDEMLVQAFTGHAAVAIERARMIDEIREQQLTAASLDAARRVQRSFMPSVFPPVPGYELGFWFLPTEAVGGDYCDVLPMTAGRIGLVMADVSGHGLGPALIMATVRATVRALLPSHSLPPDLLTALHHTMQPDLQSGKFITMVFAQLDPVTDEVHFANAGHGPALHYAAATGKFTELAATGMPLGIQEEEVFDAGRPVPMAPGDVLLLCTDGVVDAENADRERFGRKRLETAVRAYSEQSATEIAHGIGKTLEVFLGGVKAEDDLTVLLAKRWK
jgi:phosphoserine phosphatase